MRRFISFIMSFVFLFNLLFPQMAYGKSANKEVSDEELKNICRCVCDENLDKAIINELMNDGLNFADAEFYIRFDNIVKELERRNLSVNLDDYDNFISDEEFADNISYYRKKILEGDRNSLAKGLLTIKDVMDDEVNREMCRAVTKGGFYEHEFKDGSRISFENKSAMYDDGDLVSLPVDGYNEALMEEGTVYPYDRKMFKEGEWKFQSGLSYSKVHLYVEYELDEESKVSTITYARGGQSSYGVVNIANGTGASIVRESSAGIIPAEARNEVIFNVTSSFGATFSILSISINPGMNWTQYIVFKLYSITEEYSGAKYSWNAAEYK